MTAATRALLPFLCYAAFVFLAPGAWKSVFRSSAVHAYAGLSRLLVLLQVFAVLLWVWSSSSTGLCFELSQIQLRDWILGLTAAALGLALQRGALQAAGEAGLYYGARLNRGQLVEPSAWPFSLLPHPEYIGALLLVWSPVLMLAQQLPASSVFLALFWTLLFILGCFMEDYM